MLSATAGYADSGSGAAYAWGANGAGESGTGRPPAWGSVLTTPEPVRVPPGVVFVTGATGAGATVALDRDGRAWAWGSNSGGALGAGVPNGPATAVPVAVRVPTGTSFTSVAMGGTLVVAVDQRGRVWEWGTGSSGAVLGVGPTAVRSSAVPQPVHMPSGVRFVRASVGVGFVVALDSNGGLWGWGDDRVGQLCNGVKSPTPYDHPVRAQMPAGVRFTALTSGGTNSSPQFTAAVDSTGRLWYCGNELSQNNYQAEVEDVVPTLVKSPPGVRFTEVSAGGTAFAIALASNGVAYGWGNDTGGQLGAPPTEDLSRFGQGSMSPDPTPVAMPPGVRFTSVSAGANAAYAVDTTGRVWAWGAQVNGNIGVAAADTTRPVLVAMPAGARVTRVFGGVTNDSVLALFVPPAPRTSLLSTFASSLMTPWQAVHPLATVAVSAAVAAGSALLITFPANLFNSTFSENYAEIRDWWRRRLPRRRRPAPTETAPEFSRPVTFAAVVLVGALLASLNDPHFGWRYASLVTYIAVVVATCVVVAVSAASTFLYLRRRFRAVNARLRALPAGLVVAAGCVLVSRLSGFEPGYLYGVVLGVVFAHRLARHEQGHVVVVTTLATLTVAVASWFAWVPVNEHAAKPGAATPIVLFDDVLAVVFVAGLVGTVISLLPLQFLPGGKLKAWRRDVWAIMFGVAVLGLIQVLLRPHGSAPRHGPAILAAVLFVAFGVGSIAFHDHFDRKHRRARGEVVPDLRARLAELIHEQRVPGTVNETVTEPSAIG